MTDKQIIIDGVDVSGCKKLMQGIVPFGCMEDRKTCSCMNNPNCLYKQFKRKEQECEEKQKTAQDAISKLCAEKSALYNELDKLKRDNDGILTTIRILAKNNIKLRKILAEIKEIASYLFNMPTSQCMAKLELILSKISEV